MIKNIALILLIAPGLYAMEAQPKPPEVTELKPASKEDLERIRKEELRKIRKTSKALAKKFFLQLKDDGKLPDNCKLNITIGPDSHDIIMRWGYQELADHVHDLRTERKDSVGQSNYCTAPGEGITFDPKDVKKGDVVFLRGLDEDENGQPTGIHEYFEKVHPKIKHPYVIITAGERKDRMIDEYLPYLNEKNVIRWFGIHASPGIVNHQKFTALPLGIWPSDKKYDEKLKIWRVAEHYASREKLRAIFEDHRESTKKKWLLYLNAGDFNDERKMVRELFKDKEFCFTVPIGDGRPFKTKYIKDLAMSCFVLDVHGYGEDNFRGPEAALAGAIVLRTLSALLELYKGLPFYVIKDKSEWKNLTAKRLVEIYKEFMKIEYNYDKLFMEYWKALVNESRFS